MTWERARAIADAVLLEGYVLYPYRKTSTKNQYRWTFGVVAPRAWSEGGGCEPWWLETQILVEAERPRCRARLRFLQVVRRTVEQVSGDRKSPPRAVDHLEVDGQVFVPWEEGEVRELDVDVHALQDTQGFAFSFPAGEDVEVVYDAAGNDAARIVRTRAALDGVVRVSVDAVDSGHDERPLTRVTLRVENRTAHAPGAPRAAAMHASFVSTHVMFASEGDDFVSLVDPPHFAREAASACANVGTYPVLVGAPGQRDLLLSAPIILYDYPAVAPESPGDFFDATEIDEILALRTNALTPEEKVLVRATDARAAALLDRVESLSHAALEQLHGAVRGPRTAGGFAKGSRVRLRPKRAGRRTDAQDFLYDGHTATVEDVLEDVNGQQYLAVTLDDDPASELHRWYGRFHHYYLDEVEALDLGEVSR
jgi:hypothetical protein